MSEFEPGQEPLEAKLEQVRSLVMEQLGLESDQDWKELVEESREEALATITEPDGTPVDPSSLSESETQEAIATTFMLSTS